MTNKGRLIDITIRGAIAIALVVSGFKALAFLDSRTFRYQTYHCQYDITFHSTGSPGVVVAGTSRPAEAIRAESFSPKLAEVEWLDSKVVANISRAETGRAQLYILMRDLLERKTPELLLLEIHERDPSWNAEERYHPLLPTTATTSDLARIAWTDEGAGSRAERLNTFLVNMGTRALKAMELWIEDEMEDLDNGPTEPIENRDCYDYGEEDIDVEDIESYARWKQSKGSWDADSLNWQLDHPGEHLMMEYSRKIVDMARARDVRLILIHLPDLLTSPIDEPLRTSLQERIGAPVLVPPRELLEKLYQPGQYIDPAHLSLSGGSAYVDWLASELEKFSVEP